MMTGKRSVFNSKKLEGYCQKASIELKMKITESDNSLGQGETYHDMLRRIYRKVK